MIGGFIVGGGEGGSSTVVIRAIGPSLTAAGVPNALQDPKLELHDGFGALIASNDNWKDTQEVALEESQLAPSDEREAALQIALGPGAYTAIVRGADETSGVGLVEAYNLEANAALAAPITPQSLGCKRMTPRLRFGERAFIAPRFARAIAASDSRLRAHDPANAWPSYVPRPGAMQAPELSFPPLWAEREPQHADFAAAKRKARSRSKPARGTFS